MLLLCKIELGATSENLCEKYRTAALGNRATMRYSVWGGLFHMTDLQDAIREENRRIRLLRITSDLTVQVLMSGRLSASEAASLIDGVKTFALKLFPGKDHTFDLIHMPRFRRALRESGTYDRERPALRVYHGFETGDHSERN
jgi:hypothetical protein